MDVAYAPAFVRMLREPPQDLISEAKEKIDLFRDPANHKALKVHKLRGKLKDRFSFSVNYKTRIVFRYLNTNPREALLLVIGDHDIYNT